MTLKALKNHKADGKIGEVENQRNKAPKKNKRVPYSTQLDPDLEKKLRIAAASYEKSHYEIIERGIVLAIEELEAAN